MTPTTIPTALALVAAALLVEPGLTLDGLDLDSPALTDPASLRQVAAAADALADAKATPWPTRGATLALLADLAAERAGLLEVGEGAVLAVAIALGVRWDESEEGQVQLAVIPPPRWTRPTPELAAQAARRLGEPVPREAIEALVSQACTPRGVSPPRSRVAAAVQEALVAGLLVTDGNGLRAAAPPTSRAA